MSREGRAVGEESRTFQVSFWETCRGRPLAGYQHRQGTVADLLSQQSHLHGGELVLSCTGR